MTDNFPWYLSRASGLVGFILLYVSIFLGLAIRTPILKRIIKPVYSFRVHCWISFQALLFAFFHGAILLLDKFIGFSWQNIFIPFYPTSYSKAVDGDFLALGIIGFYLMLLLVATSYGRKYFSLRLWRSVHSMNVALYVVSLIHALYLGTDLREGALRSVFIYANIFLVVLFLLNLCIKLFLMLYKTDNFFQGDSAIEE